MSDHPVPGSPWVPEVLRGMLSEFRKELAQEAFDDVRFRLPPFPSGPRYESAAGSATPPRHAPIIRVDAPGREHGPRPREAGHA